MEHLDIVFMVYKPTYTSQRGRPTFRDCRGSQLDGYGYSVSPVGMIVSGHLKRAKATVTVEGGRKEDGHGDVMVVFIVGHVLFY